MQDAGSGHADIAGELTLPDGKRADGRLRSIAREPYADAVCRCVCRCGIPTGFDAFFGNMLMSCHVMQMNSMGRAS